MLSAALQNVWVLGTFAVIFVLLSFRCLAFTAAIAGALGKLSEKPGT
jgi:thiol:disulfide interchange protein DsbD